MVKPIINEEMSNDERIRSLIDLATTFLTRGEGDQLEIDEKRQLRVADPEMLNAEPGKIATFACRFSLGPHSKISNMLVKYSLATVIGVSDDRDIVCSSYPSEPVLAEAWATYTKEKKRLDVVLQHVKEAIHSRDKILDPPRGDVGEMCAAALLGYAMDHIRQSQQHDYMSQAVELKELLSLFNYEFLSLFNYGADALEDGAIMGVVKDWNVNFTHFVLSDWTPTQEDLPVMWKRRMAYYVPYGIEGLDLLIAIQNNSKGYGTLRVQVKNKSNKIVASERSKFLRKLHPSNCPPKVHNEPFSVGLLLSVHSIDEYCHFSGLRDSERVPRGYGNPEGNPVLQLATRFPCNSNSPLKWLSQQLKEICSQDTSKKIDIDHFCNGGILKAVESHQKPIPLP